MVRIDHPDHPLYSPKLAIYRASSDVLRKHLTHYRVISDNFDNDDDAYVEEMIVRLRRKINDHSAPLLHTLFFPKHEYKRGKAMLELVMMSEGDLSSEEMSFALITNLKKILERHPRINDMPANAYPVRAAIACAIGVSERMTKTDPIKNIDKIDDSLFQCDVLERFVWLVRDGGWWFREPQMLSPFSLRCLASSWCSPEEFDWAVRHCPPELTESAKALATSGGKMVKYELYNKSGVCIHDGADAYYGGKPVTLEVVHEVGGVCGALSKFSAKMLTSHGIPAMPVAQPGHCAVIYRDDDGHWAMWNNIRSTWNETTQHDGVMIPWSRYTKAVWTVECMEMCQRKGRKYLESERLRFAASIEDDQFSRENHLFLSILVCPYNLPAWIDYIRTSTTKGTIPLREASKALKQFRYMTRGLGDRLRCITVAQKAQLLVGEADPQFAAERLCDGTGSEFATKSEFCVLYIPLEGELVERIDIQFWGVGWCRDMRVFDRPVKTRSDPMYQRPVADSRSVDIEGGEYNSEITWNVEGRFPQGMWLTLDCGNGDGFGMGFKHGLRRFDVYGPVDHSFLNYVQHYPIHALLEIVKGSIIRLEVDSHREMILHIKSELKASGLPSPPTSSSSSPSTTSSPTADPLPELKTVFKNKCSDAVKGILGRIDDRRERKTRP